MLIPDVLRSIPSSLTQAIRNFAKSLEGWLTQALSGCPPQLHEVKVTHLFSYISATSGSVCAFDGVLSSIYGCAVSHCYLLQNEHSSSNYVKISQL